MNNINFTEEMRKEYYEHIIKCDDHINRHSTGINSLQTQIAALILATSPFIFSIEPRLEFPITVLIFLGWIVLILSLFFGVVDKMLSESFWKRMGEKSQNIHAVYKEAVKGNISEAVAEKLADRLNRSSREDSPISPRKAQMILLFLGIVLEFTAYAITLFSVANT